MSMRWSVAFCVGVLASGCSLLTSLDEWTFADEDGADAGPTDAGPTDAGPMDAGAMDAGPTDAGCPIRCNGVCTDTQSNPLHCGSCGHSCSAPENGEATCTEGSCGFTCSPGHYEVVGTCEPRLAPRPIAPLSTATATSRRPTFRWELAPRNDGARIEICADRACTSVLQTIDASGTSGRPATDLPTGVVFWRLYGRQGSDVGTMPSVTWQLHIGARSAEVDTSWGTTLDVNGDGFADVLVGAPFAFDETGRVYLYLGGPSGLPTTPTAVLDNGDDGGYFGSSVASAGDVDGDGYADVIIGAPGVDSWAGQAYLFRGGAGGLSTPPSAVLHNGDDGGRFGHSVASAGDVDGDGYADVIIGAYRAASGGRAYLFRGGASGLPTPPIELHNDGDDGGRFGHSVASAGDVDGDGYADVIIGAPYAASNRGRAYLFRGEAGGLSTSPTTVLVSGDDGGYFGWSVASAGDVDGDGYADVIIGAYRANSPAGRAYLFLGGAGGLPTSPTTVLDNGADGGGFGHSVASAGDVDGDGYADVIIGAPLGASNAGRAYLFRGGASGLSNPPTVVLDNGADGGDFGTSVASAGDVDGDGYADVIIGAPGANSWAGRAYLFRGWMGGLPTSHTAELRNGADGGWFGHSVARLELPWSLPLRRLRGEHWLLAPLRWGGRAGLSAPPG